MTIHPRTIAQISGAVHRARDKHPWPSGDRKAARLTMVAALAEEVGEVARALLDGNESAVESECCDAIAVLIRLIEDA